MTDEAQLAFDSPLTDPQQVGEFGVSSALQFPNGQLSQIIGVETTQDLTELLAQQGRERRCRCLVGDSAQALRLRAVLRASAQGRFPAALRPPRLAARSRRSRLIAFRSVRTTRTCHKSSRSSSLEKHPFRAPFKKA